MSSENSWSKSDLIPNDLSSNDKALKKAAISNAATQRESSSGFPNNQTFGEQARKCKIFISQSDIESLDKKVKADMASSEETANNAKKTAAKIKEEKLKSLSKHDDSIKALSDPLEKQISDTMIALKEKIVPIVDKFNVEATKTVNEVYNPTVLKVVVDQQSQIKPILDKFNKSGDFANIGIKYEEIVKEVAKKAESKDVNQAVKAAEASEKTSEVKANEPLAKSDLYEAFKSIEKVMTASVNECTEKVCPAKQLEEELDNIFGKSNIVRNITTAVNDGTSKKNLSALNTKQILNRLNDLKFDLDTQLDKTKEDVESNATIFSKRQAKIGEITQSLKTSIDSVTKASGEKITLAKKSLNDTINQLRRERDTNIKNIINQATIELNNKLKAIDDQANAIYKQKEDETKAIEKEHSDAVKAANDAKKAALKGYNYMLEKPVDGIVYYKSMTAGLLGKKSTHEPTKVLGIKNEVSMIGAQTLVVVYQRESEKKSQTTAVINVCALKQ